MNLPSDGLPRATRRRRLVMVGVGLLALGALLWVLVRRPPAPPLAELPREKLTLKDGRLHAENASTPFTGRMLEHYPDAALKSRSVVSNGLLEGVSEGWHTNGQPQVVEHFRAGVSHGRRLKWHPNGQKLSEVTIVEGKLEGMFRRWDESGALVEEITLRGGEPDGPSRAYFPSGCVKTEVQMERGQVKEQKSWGDGERRVPTLVVDPAQTKPGAER